MIRGVVTDASGAKISGATVLLVQQRDSSGYGCFDCRWKLSDLTGAQGRFFLWSRRRAFGSWRRRAFTPGSLDTLERNVVLEPEWVRESIVVTATGTPTPQPQISAATSVLGPVDLG